MIKQSTDKIKHLAFLLLLLVGVVLVVGFAFVNWMVAVAIVVFYVVAGMIRRPRS